MPNETDWEACKREFWTADNLCRKTKLLFPNEDPEEILALFESLSDGWSNGQERLGLAILRNCEWAGKAGDRATLDALIQCAREDYRDLLIGEYLREAELEFKAATQEKNAAREADAREVLEWLQK